ncbi:MAG: site-2 protease family protein [Phycisphaerae bacterium]
MKFALSFTSPARSATRRRSLLATWFGTSRAVLYCSIIPLLAATALSGALDSARRWVLLTVGFGAVIFFHELGHFLTAKRFGVRCDVFSVGIGPRLCGWRKGVGFTLGPAEIGPPQPPEPPSAEQASLTVEGKAISSAPAASAKPAAANAVQEPIGETDYRIAWLPFGGYVRMLGQDDMDPTKVSDDPKSFTNKPIWQRMIIISAGVVMNLILALIIFAIIFRVGVAFPPAVVGSVAWNSPAQKAGLQVGDRIISINGNKPRGFLEFTDLGMAAALDKPGQPVALQYERGNSRQVYTTHLIPVKSMNTGFLAFGVGQMLTTKIARLSKADMQYVLAFNPTLKGIASHDVITAVNGKPVTSYVQIYQALQTCDGRPLAITLKNANPKIGTRTIQVTPQLTLRDWVVGDPALLGMYPRALISAVLPDSAAAAAGFKAGDVILRAGVQSHPDVAQVIHSTRSNPGQKLTFEVLRQGKVLTLHPTIASTGGKGQLGVAITPDFTSPVIASVNRRDANLGILPGQTIAAIEPVDVPSATTDAPASAWQVHSWYDVLRIGKLLAGKPAVMLLRGSDGQISKVNIPMVHAAALDEYEYKLGLPCMPLLELQKTHSIGTAMLMGLDHTTRWIDRTYQTLFGLSRGSIPTNQLHSIVGIAKVGYDIESRGFAYLLFFLGLISVNLAVINFLPLPIVDGGLFVLLILEKLRGKPLPLKVQAGIQLAGIILLASVFLYITVFNDIPMLFHH